MKIWLLEPNDTTTRDWQASTYANVVYVRAPTEKRARELAVSAFVIAVHHRPGEKIVVCPWHSAAHVRATEQKASEYAVDGPEGIVGPSGITNYVDEEFLG